jgi:hypothetical protein
VKRFLIFLAIIVYILPPIFALEEKDIKFSGRLVVDYIYRDSSLEEIAGEEGWSIGGGESIKSADFFNHLLEIKINTRLSEKLSLDLMLANKRIKGGRSFGKYLQKPLLRGASIKIRDFLFKETDLKFGLQNLKISPFFLDLQESESIWDIPLRGVPNISRELLDPFGFSLKKRFKDSFSLEFAGAILSEEGTPTADEKVFYGAFYMPYLGIILANFSGGRYGMPLPFLSSRNQSIWTLGLISGAEFSFDKMGLLRVYLQAYRQFGRAGEVVIAGNPRVLTAKGMAFSVDAKYIFERLRTRPWIKISYLYCSGDPSNLDSSEERFLSYESIKEFLIIEDGYFGLDIDTNYKAIKFGCGIKAGDAELSMFFGNFRFVENLPISPLSPPEGLEATNDLGSELDLEVSFKLTKDLSLRARYAMLFGAEALKIFTERRKDHLKIFLFGADLRF